MATTVLAGPYTLTITSGQTDSAALSTILSVGQMKQLYNHATRVNITSPATLTGTVSPQIEQVEGGSNWTIQQINGTDVTLTVSRSDLFPLGPFKDFRMHSTTSEGADRAFIVSFQLEP